MSDPLFEGVYGTYSIDERDRRKVALEPAKNPLLSALKRG